MAVVAAGWSAESSEASASTIRSAALARRYPLVAVDPEPIRLLNVQGRRYAEDNDKADIAAIGEVLVAG